MSNASTVGDLMSNVIVSLECLASHLCDLYGENDPLYLETVAISNAYLKRANSFTDSGEAKKTTKNSLCAHPKYCCGCNGELGEIQGYCVSPNCEYLMRPQPCRKCGGAMERGKAIEQTWTAGMPDFIGENDIRCQTFSPGGPGRIIPCWKCKNCGHSITLAPPKNG